ncbi:MAG: mechanosensitive ion channel family protein [Spirochaetales bacterium]
MFKFLKRKNGDELENTPKKEKGKGLRPEQKSIIVIISLVVLVMLVSVLVPAIFPGSQIATIIDNSLGKFFNIVDFFKTYYVTILESVTILFFIWLIEKVLSLLLSVLMKKGKKNEMMKELFKSIVKYASVIAAIFLILSAWGVQTPTLLAGAGIFALAISFGAQSLIEDIISGLFIIFEKQFSVGDVIQIGDFRGTVLSIGIRITKVEDLNGDIKIINNSDIRGAINTSAHLSLAICDISISYSADIKKVEDVILKNLPQIKEKIADIAEGPFYRGVQKLGDSSVVIQVYAKTKESKRYQVVRDLNREMKILFDENGIQIPFPQIVVHMENDKK